MNITWNVNGTTSNNDNITRLGIVTNGGGSQKSHLTIPGYPQYNNTVVKCSAIGNADSSPYKNTNESILRIQGNTLSDICHYISSH